MESTLCLKVCLAIPSHTKLGMVEMKLTALAKTIKFQEDFDIFNNMF